ncbi:hypothetical protein F0L68_29795 [Solihabitans fulvus]|uniref:Uncharacterized protein n=1 Tax=Solihabitans fulvus TaxID=1892852 RepID=A0A5B2WWY9_9PSEU|nr:hypothetical protein [Solihabitans fulvus]KAA2254966.1 hypothetical protein F0L68_29795 [Solihabitans fulvus]
MDERELKDALREVMVASSPPPPMAPEAALRTAHSARRRRRAMLTGGVAALAVVGIAVGAVLVPRGSGGGLDSAGSGAKLTNSAPPTQRLTGTATHPGSDTKTVWPTGPNGKPQTDRTASSGPRFDQGAKLLNQLASSVPAGYAVPENLKAATQNWVGPLTHEQAQFEQKVGDREIWQYSATTPVTKSGDDSRVGELFTEVDTAGNNLPADLCLLAQKLWGMPGECQVVDVAGKPVGVVTKPTSDRKAFDQWAAYRHPDGTVVYVAQAREYANTGLTGLGELPLTVQQLAALATDPKFRLD